jgi:putative ABC transport system permease protein
MLPFSDLYNEHILFLQPHDRFLILLLYTCIKRYLILAMSRLNFIRNKRVNWPRDDFSEGAIYLMGIILRGMANVLRNPVRLILVVVLLGASLMFVAAMTSLNNSAQQEIASVHSQVGTSITINYAENNAGQFGGTFGGNGANGGAGSSTGGSTGSTGTGNTAGGTGRNRGATGTPGATTPPRNTGGFGNVTTTPIPATVVTTVSQTAGITSTEETVRQTDTDGKLTAGSITTPNGNKITLSPTVYGISNGATHYILGTGSTPKIVAGTSFLTNGSSADVAMMSQTLATTNKLKVGSTFTIKGKTFTLVALYTTGTTGTADQIAGNTIVIPLSVAESLYAVKGVDSITAYATTYDQVNAAAAKLKTTLGSKYDVVTSADSYQSTFSALSVAQNSIYLALIVSVIVAIVVIIFAVFIVVRERTTEIGILKAIGASHWQVIRQFWGEVLAMSGLGAIIGIVLLAVFGPLISQKFNVNTTSTAATGAATTGRTFNGFGGGGGTGGGGATGAGGRGFGGFFGRASTTLTNVHIASATLNLETVLIIVGSGIALAILTSIIPAWYVARIKPAVVLRKGN